MVVELKEDVFYTFGDMRVKATTDYDFNPIIEFTVGTSASLAGTPSH